MRQGTYVLLFYYGIKSQGIGVSHKGSEAGRRMYIVNWPICRTTTPSYVNFP